MKDIGQDIIQGLEEAIEDMKEFNKESAEKMKEAGIDVEEDKIEE